MLATRMKAIVNDRYGSPPSLKLQEVERPHIGDDGVLIRVRAASVNPLDWRPMLGRPLTMRLAVGGLAGLRRPGATPPGVDVAGVVEAVGQDVTEFKPGDEVFGGRSGAFAEYLAGRERNFVHKPASLTFEEAAAIPVAGCTAIQALRDKGQLQPGQRVLVNGAAGGVGTFTVQIAKAMGADVTAVCSTRNVEMVRALGADRAIDYTKGDFTKGGQKYDLVVDNVGNRALRHLRRVMTSNGTLVIVGAKKSRWMLALLGLSMKARITSRFVDQTLVSFFLAKLTKDDYRALTDLIGAGKLKPIVDRSYPLSEAAEAVRYAVSGHARAKVVITV